MKLKLSPQARSDIRTAHAWWKANRPAAPHLLRDELRKAFDLLREQPQLGGSALDVGAHGIRRIYLRGTRYFLYYSVHEEAIEVLRLWHASRGKKPAP